MTLKPSAIAAPVDLPVLPTLLRIGKLVRVYQNLRLAEIGLQNGQDEFLLGLSAVGQLTVAELATLLGVRASTISKMTDVLGVKGYVERVQCAKDLRKVYVRLTADGLALCAAIHTIWDGLEVDLLCSAVGSDGRVLRRELTGLQEHVARRLSRLR